MFLLFLLVDLRFDQIMMFQVQETQTGVAREKKDYLNKRHISLVWC